MELRAYRDDDRRATREVFERAVHRTAAADYSPEQLEAWAPGLAESDLDRWAAARSAAKTVVAVVDGKVIGFSDLVGDSTLDMLYVDPDAGRSGVAGALIEEVCRLAREQGADTIEADASLTARPLFERHGFVVVEERMPVLDGVAMPNFRMRLSQG
jgi:putative acetyltransferase